MGAGEAGRLCTSPLCCQRKAALKNKGFFFKMVKHSPVRGSRSGVASGHCPAAPPGRGFGSRKGQSQQGPHRLVGTRPGPEGCLARVSERKEVGTKQRTGPLGGGLELRAPGGAGPRWAWLLTGTSSSQRQLRPRLPLPRDHHPKVSVPAPRHSSACAGYPSSPPPRLISAASLGLSKARGQSALARIQTRPRPRQQQCGRLLWPHAE